MNIPPRALRLVTSRWAAFALLLAFIIVICTAWPDPLRVGSAASNGGAARHKVRVRDAKLAAEIARRGGRLVAAYDSFQVFEVGALPAAWGAQDGIEARDEENSILFNAGRLDTRMATRTPARPPQHLNATKAPGKLDGGRGKRLRVIQFGAPIQPAWHEALTSTGVEIVDYIPHNAYLIYGDDEALAQASQWAAAQDAVQWEGEYQSDFKIAPNALAPAVPRTSLNSRAALQQTDDLYAIQLVRDTTANAATLARINLLRSASIKHQFRIAHFINLVVPLPQEAVTQLADAGDVISISRYYVPHKFDERQDMIVAGNLTGTQPTPGDYYAWLAAQGLTQAQFTASNFVVNVSDSGLDNGTVTPNHFGLYLGGVRPGTSRVAFARLVGTASGAGSTLAGCDGHGTINAHIIAGFIPTVAPYNAAPHVDAQGFRYGLGVAPFVRVGSSVIFDNSGSAFGDYTYPDYSELESRSYQNNARISSNSWGESNSGGYNIDAQAYDYLVRDAQPDTGTSPIVAAPGNQENVIVFAAGNDGPNAQTVGAPGTAKNIITAGATENVQAFGGPDQCNISDTAANSADDIANFSSRGPTSDGRKKPDLVAPGTHVTGGVYQIANPPALGQAGSCFNASGVCAGVSPSDFFPTGQQWYTASSGTSHSTPAIAGAAALLRQRFLNDGLTAPSPAMTKAALINAARYLTGTGANDTLWSNSQGMGAVNLKTAFGLFGTPTLLRDQVAPDLFTASGQTRTFTGTISDPTKPFRVTLAWTDAPGSTAGNAYVNNLDLEVTINGQTYKGNVFSGAFSTTGGSFDQKNNVESVLLPAGASGSFTVKITATNIAGDGVPGNATALDQDFALVVYNMAEGLQPLLAANGSALTAESCAPGNGVLDPGEVVTVDLALKNLGRSATTNLTATLLETGGVINANQSLVQNYGALAAFTGTATRPFTFRAGGVCGGTVTATLQLQDGATNLGTVTFTFSLGTSVAQTASFSNNGAITIPATGTVGNASPFPSTISVTGTSGTISKVTVTLTGITHTFPDNLDLLLVSPAGQTLMLMSDCGGSNGISNVNLTFDDAATGLLPDRTTISSGTYKPTDYEVVESFPSPAPAGPYSATALATFNGASANGTWRLYVIDDLSNDSGQIAGGWSLTITTQTPSCCVSAACNLSITTTSIAGGTINTGYTQPLNYTGNTGNVVFSTTSTLPNGITLSSGGAGGTLAGTPTQVGSFPLTVTAIDAQGCGASRDYTLTIACQTITVTAPGATTATTGASFTRSFSQSGGIGTTTFSTASALPGGVTLTAGGTLSGTPTTTGTYPIAVVATDANGCTGSVNYTLTVSCPQITVTPPANNTATAGTNFSYSFTQSGGSGAPNFTTTSTLPNGVTLASNGALGGTPTQTGTFPITVKATDIYGCFNTANYQLTINCPTITVTAPTTTTGTVGTLFSQTFTQSGGVGTVMFSTASALPNGVILTTSGTLTGTPTASGVFPLVVKAADANNCTGTINYTLTINAGPSGLQYYPLPQPVRLLDTRPDPFTSCIAASTPLADNSVTTLLATGACTGIPATAKAIVGNATVVNSQSAGGYMTLWPADAPLPNASNLNYIANQVVPNAFTVGLDASGQFKVAATGSTNFIVDITGYYAPPGAGGLYFHPLAAPVRLLDTRPDPFTSCIAASTPLADNSTTTLLATGACTGIPATAKAIVGNATVVNFQSPGGYITLFPSGAAPNASNLNYTTNQVVPNAFTVGLDASGNFRVYAAAGTDFIVDVSGYYDDQAAGGLLFYPLSAPGRWLDTRPDPFTSCVARSTPLAANELFSLQAAQTCGGLTIPATAKAVLGNATVVNLQASDGYITLWPAGLTQPNASNLNFVAGQVVPNAFVVGLNASGAFNILSTGTTDFLIDLSGYFAP